MHYYKTLREIKIVLEISKYQIIFVKIALQKKAKKKLRLRDDNFLLK